MAERNALVEANLGLVSFVVRGLGGRIDALDRDDAFQVGSLGLMKAARYFRPDAGFKFSTYATVCVRNAVIAAADREAKRRAAQRTTGEILDLTAPPDDADVRLDVEDLLSRLPPDLRVVLALGAEGFTAAEIGTRLGVARATVEGRRRRALQSLRLVFREH